jgi:hypothetical protein
MTLAKLSIKAKMIDGEILVQIEGQTDQWMGEDATVLIAQTLLLAVIEGRRTPHYQGKVRPTFNTRSPNPRQYQASA